MSVPLHFRRVFSAPHSRRALLVCCFSLLTVGTLRAPIARAEEQPAKQEAPEPDLAAKQAEARAKIKTLTEKLEKTPNDVDSLIARAAAYYMAEEFEKQEADAREATRLAPKRPDAWQALGKACFTQNDDKEAITAFDKAIELGAKNPEVFFDQGVSLQQLEDHKRAIAAFTASLGLKAQNDQAYFGRGLSLKAIGDLESAMADFNRTIDLAPHQLVYRSERAQLLFDHHEIERGLEDVKEAIRLNPGDLGVNYKPTTDKELSPAALAHGEAQVEQMLKDRPEMAKHVTKGDKIWTWAARKFAGEDLGALVDWDATSPAPSEADCNVAHESRHACIRVGLNYHGEYKQAPKTFDELWSRAVFELHNVGNATQWAKISQQVAEVKFDRDQYILAILNGEDIALQRTRAFYIAFYFPWLVSKHLTDTDPTDWHVTTFRPTANFKDDLKAWGDDPRIAIYAAGYDLERAAHEHMLANYARVKELVAPHVTVSDAISPSEAQKARYWLGCAECGLNNFEEGVKELTAALELAPGETYVLLARGQANQLRSHSDEAIADFSEVVGLKPSDPAGYYYRAQEYVRLGNFEAALRDAEKVVEIEPKSEAHLLRAQIWERKNEYTKALTDYAKAIELAPKGEYAYRCRAYAWYQQKEYDKCLADWETLIELNPKDDEALANRGWILFLKKSYKTALVDLNRAIELNPKSYPGLTSRAELLLTSEDLSFRNVEQGFKDAKTSCELTDWKEPYMLALLAQAYAAKKDLDNAIKWQKKALENPNPELKGKWERALADFEQQAKSAIEPPSKGTESP